MNKVIVLSCVKDDCYSNNAEHFLAKHLDDVKAGVLKFAEMNNADKCMVLLAEGMTDPGFDWEVKFAIKTPTADNPYSCQQQFLGKLPRPMIQDDFVAVYEDREIAVILPENAYWLGKNDFSIKHITINGEVKEVAVGSKLGDSVDVSDAKAVLLGGLKGRMLAPTAAADMEVTVDELFNSVTVIPSSACIVDYMVKHMNEAWKFSCGKCVMCRESSLQFKTILEEMIAGKAKGGDPVLLSEVGELVKAGSYCPYGQNMPQPMIDALAMFVTEFEAHIKKKSCPAGVCFQKGATYVILPDKCTGCTDCIDECDEMAIEGKKNFIHMIDQDMCESCGKCVDACDEEAIVIVEGKMPKLPKKLTRVGKF
ncbi:MAG: 4Fe-4S binding protein [Parasporobacterium sp.]|nr:4Fe-4S binding protein [Parasporobacterium sp.]